MADTRNPRFLALPRELRNHIYTHLSAPRPLTTNALDSEKAKLNTAYIMTHTAPSPALLRTCKQLHAEYTQIWPQAQYLAVVVASNLNLSTDSLSLHPSFPHSRIFASSILRCDLNVDIMLLFNAIPLEKAQAFSLRHRGQPQTQLAQLAWTPSQSMVEGLEGLLLQLEGWLPNAQSVRILIGWRKPGQRLEDAVQLAGVEPARFRALEDDSGGGGVRGSYARQGKLQLCFRLDMSAYCVIETEPAVDIEVAQSGGASTGGVNAEQQDEGWTTVNTAGGRIYRARDAEERVTVLCQPLRLDDPKLFDGRNFAGFDVLDFWRDGVAFGNWA